MDTAQQLTQLAKDFAFIEGQFRAAPALRTVAALNPLCSKAEFIQAATAAGYPSHAAGARFGESRKFDRDSYGATFDADGRALAEY